MSTIKFDHMYVSVEDMDRAIAFYEDLLGMKVSYREANQWADFRINKTAYFGLIGAHIIGAERRIGNNATPVFWADDVDAVYEKVKSHGVKIYFPPKLLPHSPHQYYCFACQDTEGNSLEIANYQRNI